MIEVSDQDQDLPGWINGFAAESEDWGDVVEERVFGCFRPEDRTVLAESSESRTGLRLRKAQVCKKGMNSVAYVTVTISQ